MKYRYASNLTTAENLIRKAEFLLQADLDIDYKNINFERTTDGVFMQLDYKDTITKLSGTIFYRTKRWNDINGGEPVQETHIMIPEDSQGKGLAGILLKAFMWRDRVTLWFVRGRVINPDVYKVIDKIRQDSNFEVIDYEDGITIRKK